MSMKSYLYKFFHEKTNDRTENGLVKIPKDKAHWPSSWKEIERKIYHRAEKIILRKPLATSSLYELLLRRNSDISKIVSGNISIDDIASLMSAGYGQLGTDTFRRTVPSGGGRFPLELYVSIWGQVDGLPPGNYHYDVVNSQLEKLVSRTVSPDTVHSFTPLPWVADAHGVILLSAVFERTIDKYGSRGYRYILLEAGHVGQNISLAAAESGLSVRPLGAIDEIFFESLFSLDSEKEQVVYAIIF